MKRIIIIGVLLIVLMNINFHTIRAAGPPKLTEEQSREIAAHYQEWQFSSLEFDEGQVVNYGLLQRSQSTEGATLLVFLDGSGYRSAFGLKEKERWVYPGTPYSFAKRVFPNYDFLVPEKINITIGGDHSNDPRVLDIYTLQNRVQATARVIDVILSHHNYAQVYMLGISEGGYILPAVYHASSYKTAMTKLVVWGAGGLSQEEEFRLLAESDLPMPQGLKRMYVQVDEVCDAIYANPTSTTLSYFGHSYQRWASFFAYTPLDDLVLIDIPILLLHGAKDINSPVETARVAAVEFEKRKKSNLTYYEYADMGHGPSTPEQRDTFIGNLQEWLDDDA
jgi:pimeloyl-ACP methyl ester carboxylesterase